MILYSLKDNSINEFLSVVQFKSSDQFKLALKMQCQSMTNKDFLIANSDRLDLYQLGSIDVVSGVVKSDVKKLDNLKELLLSWKMKL